MVKRKQLRMNARNGSVSLPVEPVARWLDGLVAESVEGWSRRIGDPLTPESCVAALVGISVGQLRNYRNRKLSWVLERNADRMCCCEGRTHLSDLYPQYWAIADAGGPRRFLESEAA